MFNRRKFMGAAAGSIAATSLTSTIAPRSAKAEETQRGKKRLAVVTTEWRYRSHAWHMAERFLAGFPLKGKWRHSPYEVVSAYVDQTPANDLSRSRSKEFGFPIYDSIAKALRCGTNKLSVDAVLVIGEHGDYPLNDIGQKKYPRYEFFQEVVKVFREDGRTTPMFNDKHLSWKWDWAQEMVTTSREMGFPYLAGSSLPVTWRMPAIDMPLGSQLEEVMSVAMGRVDSYDFHALEVIQCMAERRKGGETGVDWVEAIRGPQVWRAMEKGSFEKGGWNPQLFEACLCRTQTLAQAPTNSHRHPTVKQIREWVKDPIVYRFQYKDGLRGVMMLMNGLVNDFTFAGKFRGREEPLSTLFYLPPGPNIAYSGALMSQVDKMFTSGIPPYPVERTLLTGGLVEAGVRSLATGKRVATPYMNVRYTPPKASTFAND